MTGNRSRRELLLGGSALGAVALAGCLGFTGPAVTDRETRSLDPAGVERVAVDNRNGDVTVEPGTGDRIEVRIEKRGRTAAALDRVDVVESTAGSRLRLETEAPNDLSNVVVDLDIALPAGVALTAARTGNGDAVARGVAGDATLSSANGDARAVDVDGFVTVETANGDAVARGTTGVVSGTTANGDVDVEVFALREDASFTTANGDVTLGVAADLDATVSLSVGNGDIEVAVPLEVTRESRSRVEGRLGNGGPSLTASSGNGNVSLSEL